MKRHKAQSSSAARFSRGVTLHQQGKLADAEQVYRAVVRQQPTHAEAWHHLGILALQTGRVQHALELINKAIMLNPNQPEAYCNRGVAQAAIGQTEAALASYDRAIAMNPDYASAWNNRGSALANLDRPEDAVASFDRAIALRAEYAEAHTNRAATLMHLGLPEAALASCEQAILLKPDHAEAHNNRGNALRDLGRADTALASYDTAIALRPDNAEMHNNRGNALRDLGRPEVALSGYAKAIALNPDYAEARWNQGVCHLSLGEYERGWKQYEWRWRLPVAVHWPDLPGEPWLGESPIDGKTILVRAEQGFGDALQFCRYIPMLAERATVILDVRRPLLRLLSGLRGVTHIVATGDRPPPFDAWTPMLSLPLAFRTRLETIPSAVPYLHADPEQVAAWRQRLTALPGRKVGIVWAGSPQHEDPRGKAMDRRRSMTLQHFAPLAGIPGLSLISLQKGEPAAQVNTSGVTVHDWTAELNDFADTAALVEALDLVITVDTSVAHLAGALARPVWVLNRLDQCWRWLLDRTDSPWYPTARLFRQRRPGDWDGVIRDVAEMLRAEAATAASSKPPVAAPSRETDPAVELSRGLASHQQGNLAEAEQAYLAVLHQRPNHFDALHLLGVIALQTGRLERAVELIAKATAQNPNHAEAHSNLGVTLAALRRNDEAVASYDRAIALKPDYAEAFNNRGAALAALGQAEAALSSFDRAIAFKPDYVEPHFSRAGQLAKLRRFDAALSSYDQVIALRPDLADAHLSRGNTLWELGRADAALSAFAQAIELRPDHAEAYNNRAAALLALGRPDQALRDCGKAIEIRPDFAEPHYNRANAQRDLGHHEAALESYDRAIALRLEHAEAHNNRGAVLAHLGRLEEALSSYDQAIALKPGYAEAYNNRGAALVSLGRVEEALSCYDQAIALNPNYAEARYNRGLSLAAVLRPEEALADYDAALALLPNNAAIYNDRGNALRDLGRPEDAIQSYNQAIAARPHHAQPYNNRGVALMDLRRAEEASLSYDQAIALDPDYAKAHWNQSICRLSLGDFERGWKEYEWRWKAGFEMARTGLIGPPWLGDSPIDGKTILVTADQGLGDSLHFCRYVPMLAKQATVVLDVPRPLQRLFSGLEGAAQVVAIGEKLPPFDTWIPMASLPFVFRTTLATIPAAVPYLHADPDQANAWRQRLARLPGRKIGLVWAGSPEPVTPGGNAVVRRRATTLRHYAPLATIPGLCLISLQKGEPAKQSRTPPDGMVLHDWTGELNDFAGTAALVEALDLVITIDTSVAHLAGALGKPVWVLNRYDEDWRWLRDRTDSPWYPSMRLFRQQTPGDWDGLMREVAGALLAEHEDTDFNQALARYRQGELSDAETILRRLPAHAEARHLRGLIALRNGQAEQAVELIGEAIALNPDLAEAHGNLGAALAHLGRPEAALASYETAIALNPEYAEAYNNRGAILADLGRTADAMPCYDRAIALQPDYPEPYYNRGLLHAVQDRPAEALSNYDSAIALKPDYADAHIARGNVLRVLGRPEAALESYDSAIALRPDAADAYNNRGAALSDLGRYEAAVADYARAIVPRPDHADAYANRGAALVILGRYPEALPDFDRAIALNPNHADAHANRGAALIDLGQPEEALSSCVRAVALKPESAEARYSKALCHLTLGDYERGWPDYESRWRLGFAPARPGLPTPYWTGQASIDNKTVLVVAEQGSGDTFQFCRYVPMLAERATVVLDVPRPLLRLLSSLKGVSRVIAHDEPAPRFDTWIPMMSLPLAFGTTRATIPATVPYLHADPERTAAWKLRLASLPGRKVGLVWAGSPFMDDPRYDAVDQRRSITLDHYAPLAAIPGLCLISLQKGTASAQAKTPPPGMVLHDWTDELNDFADTAALIEALDLVVSVDTSVAHLTGALGKPVWVPNRYDQWWAWFGDRTHSAWYPTARLFRQHGPGDWTGAIREVADALRLEAPPGAIASMPANPVERVPPAHVREPDIAADFNHGVALHQKGKLADAEAVYQAILRQQPDHANSLHLLGVIALQTGRASRAVELIGEAIAHDPNNAEAYSNRGAAMVALGRTEEALSSYDHAIALKPHYAEAHNNRGAALRDLRRPDEALVSFDAAIALKPDYAEAHNNRGEALFSLGQSEAALSSFDQAIAARPGYAEPYHGRARVLTALGYPEESLSCLDTAIALRPDFAMAFNSRGNVLRTLGRFEAALSSYDQAISLRPDDAETHNNRAAVLLDLGRAEAAVDECDRAIALKPDFAEPYYNRGNASRLLGQPDAALASYDTAIALRPDHAETHNNRGSVLADLGRAEAASRSYDRAIALNPDYAEARFNQSVCRLSLGDYETGWALFEWRWKARLAHAARGLPGQPWLGDSPIDGKTILVHAEQGFGDSLQFCRYLPLLASRATVVLEAPRPLVRFLSGLRGVTRVIATGDPLPPFDAWIPIMSLPLAFHTTLATIPATIPYLYADPEQSAMWRRRLAALPGRKIGLVWAGSPRPDDPLSNAVDQRRSITLQHYAPLATIPGLSLISLQKGDAAAQATSPPAGMLLHDWTDELHDFADTAALIEALDLVITVDTAVAHVAGSLGKPVWILNRFDQCWRWLRDRTDSPWYPSARLFQQRTQGDWAGVIHDVVEALRQSPTAPDDAFARATALHQQFRLAEAEIIYRAIPPHHPDHAEARHRLGIIALQTGRLENAVDLIGEAIALNPNDAAALSNRGTALADLGRFEEAVASFDRAIVAQPGNAVMHCNRGTALWKMGRHEDALADFDRAIELKPDHAEAYSNRGAALADLDRAQEALDSCDKAIELNPDHAESYYNRGNALRYLKRPDAALLSYDKAIELRPNHAALYNNRGLALTDLGRHDEAVASFDKAIALQPDHAEAHNNRGIALSYLGQPEAALANYDAAIALKPDYAEAHRNRGDVLAELGRPEAALTNYDRAITLKPDLTEAYWNQSLCRLMIGDYETGWKLYEWRWKAGLARARPELPEPPWLGETPIDGKTILVHAEQGFGDAIQFCRYLPMLAERATVILDVRRPLSRLLSRLPGVSRVITFEDTLPPFDAWIPMMSLPLVFNTTLATIPDSVPYLTADPKQTAIWKQRLAAFPGRKAGLVWAGSRRHENLNSKAVDGRRSMSLRQFAPLAGISGLTLISLQKGGPAAQASTAGVALHDWTAELNDFADTAALIEALDLVISVDTAVVHLAGALGKPVWVLNRYDQDWRWLRNRTDSPWYPTARLFRQHSLGDWSGVIEDLVAALRAAE